MITDERTYVIPSEHKDFFTDFQALMKKHPGAATRFALADVGPNAGDLIARGGRPPELDCRPTEFGLFCKPISPKL